MKQPTPPVSSTICDEKAKSEKRLAEVGSVVFRSLTHRPSSFASLATPHLRDLLGVLLARSLAPVYTPVRVRHGHDVNVLLVVLLPVRALPPLVGRDIDDGLDVAVVGAVDADGVAGVGAAFELRVL